MFAYNYVKNALNHLPSNEPQDAKIIKGWYRATLKQLPPDVASKREIQEAFDALVKDGTIRIKK